MFSIKRKQKTSFTIRLRLTGWKEKEADIPQVVS
jgi:hypothetical protein